MPRASIARSFTIRSSVSKERTQRPSCRKPLSKKPLPALNPGRPGFRPGGLIYELPVRAFTQLHPDIPGSDRGTLRALAHPAIIEHLRSLHVDAVELMPVAAWIDERHLPPLGLSNAWGYNPVTMLALDPRLAPGGMADLRFATAALQSAGISVILDVVFNHIRRKRCPRPDAVAARARQQGLLSP